MKIKKHSLDCLPELDLSGWSRETLENQYKIMYMVAKALGRAHKTLSAINERLLEEKLGEK